ncbi:MAG: NAD-dependent succinate-semialdehyde dehydrogenase [Gammaproteobacteria bacterium]|nr:NAD-dependent succinate-semialdehyde dehydrogenase [Gammaproteobacteria bacterium]
MNLVSINPATGVLLKTLPGWDERALEQCLQRVARVTPAWAAQPLAARAALLRQTAVLLRARKATLARLITQEMGKLLAEAHAEIEKCAWGCEYYAEQGARFLGAEVIPTEAAKSYVCYEPLGTVLAVMPWNFPFWQVFRCAVPALMAGNTVLLKHASNVPQCALAIEELFGNAGFPADVFRTLLIENRQVERVIADARVHAVSVTGSVTAGRAVAAAAGAHLKKTVLELGGSDAFIVLEDADLESTVTHAVTSRFLNAGQSCIAAKRMIVLDDVADEFVQRLKAALERLLPGDPLADTTTLAPLARADLRDELHVQVRESIAQGAQPVTGCAPLEGRGNYYAASLLDRVEPGMRAYDAELFGPVACVIRARDEHDAVRIANDTRFGLGASVWTQDSARGERIARALRCGAAFVNGIVKSDPRLPFGGIKDSGYGRELSHHGLHEFVNIKTVWIK